MSDTAAIHPEREDRPGYVPDLHAKLDYLIKERGDRRPVGNRKLVHVTTQDALAAALFTHSSTIGRWREAGRIPNLSTYQNRIAEIFDCDIGSFKRDSFEEFKRKCEAANVLSWDRLVQGSPVLGVVSSVVVPAAPPPQMRHAGPEGEDWDDDSTPILQPQEAFRVEFTPPGGAPAWIGWHVLLFSREGSHYLNWLPRFAGNPAFMNIERVPSLYRGDLHLPQVGGQLRVGRRARGEHDVVLIVSRAPVSVELHQALARAEEGAALQPSSTCWHFGYDRSATTAPP